MKWVTILIALLLALPAAAQEEIASLPDEAPAARSGLSAAEIAAVPQVAENALTPIHDLLHDRWYKRVNGTVPVFNAPGGEHVRNIDTGFNFVTALSEADGWTQINGNEWVETRHLEDTNWVVSRFTGIQLPNGLPEDYTIAWSLVNMYPSPAPGAGPSEQFDMIYRYTRLNIYDTVAIDGQRWYQIAPDQWVHQFRVSKIVPLERPDDVTTDIWVSIDLYEQNVVAYEGDQPIFATLVATGLPRWPTYEGTFNIYYRNPREHMSWGTVGDDFYSLEEVPWTMYFDHGRALHGAYWHDGFGYRRSHGCVNMSITDAKWMYDWVAESMGSRRSADVEAGPNVYVYSSGEYE